MPHVRQRPPDAAKGDLDVTKSVNIVGVGKDLTIVDGGCAAHPGDVMAAGFDPKTDLVETSAGFGDRVFHVVSEPLAPNEAVTINAQLSGSPSRAARLPPSTGCWHPISSPATCYVAGGGGRDLRSGRFQRRWQRRLPVHGQPRRY